MCLQNRISYAPVIIIPITDNIMTRFSCGGKPIGCGYYDVPAHKSRKCLDGCNHKIINLLNDSFTMVQCQVGYRQKIGYKNNC